MFTLSTIPAQDMTFIQETALFAAIHQQPVVSLELFDQDQNQASPNRQVIVEHTVAVIQHLQAMHTNALQMCVRLYFLREEFSKFPDGTWTEYCKKNFSHYGLSESGIRAAVRTGKNISRLTRDTGSDESLNVLSNLSRAALFAFGDAPEVIQEKLLEEVAHVIEERNGKAPGAEEIKRKIEELSLDLVEKDDLIKAKDGAIHRLNNALNARETECIEMRGEIDRLQKKMSNQAQAVVHQLPPGIKDAQDLKNQIEEEISRKRDELAHAEAESLKLKEEIARQTKTASLRAHAQNALDALESDIKNLQMKYTEVLADKIRGADRNNQQTLDRLANCLRAMADTLAPSMV